MVTKDVHYKKVQDQLLLVSYDAEAKKKKNVKSKSNIKEITQNKLKEAVKNDQKQLMEAIDEIVQNRIGNVDLKSYDFESDPDCSYRFDIQKLLRIKTIIKKCQMVYEIFD